MNLKLTIENEIDSDIECIYSSKSYQKLFERKYNSEARFLKVSKSGKNAFLPFIQRKLENNNYEAFSCYGYGGMYGYPIQFTEIDIYYLKEFLSKLNIHSLFIRHSPCIEDTSHNIPYTHKVVHSLRSCIYW